MGRMVEKEVVKKVKTPEEFDKTIEEMEEQGYLLKFAYKETLVFEYVGKEEIERLRKEFLEGEFYD